MGTKNAQRRFFISYETGVQNIRTRLGNRLAAKFVAPGPNVLTARRDEFINRLRGRHFLKGRILKT